MHARILVPVDGSPAAEEAIPVAVALARRSGAELQLAFVHVGFGIAAAAAGEPFDFGALDEIQSEDEVAYLARVTARIGADGDLRVVSHHLPGPVVAALATHAAAAEVDLIVMSTHGRGRVGRFWLGSVADELIRTADVPVLLLGPSNRSSQFEGFRRVLVPLDLSRLAEHALVEAQELVDPMDGQCLLLHVAQPAALMAVAPFPFGIIPDLTTDQTARSQAEVYLEMRARRLRRAGVSTRTQVRVAGSASIAILEEAENEQVDAIVLTTHGAGGLRRFVIGSVVDRVVRGAEVPVLVCRPRVGKRVGAREAEHAVDQPR